MIPRFGPAPLRARRYTLRPGAYALLPLGDRVLITRQLGDEDEFQLPGGGVDPGECPLRALHREVYEETGYRIAAPRRLGAFRRFVYMPEYELWAEKLCHIYMARPTLRVGQPLEPLHEVHWLPRAEVPELLGNSGDRAFAQAVL